MLKRHVARRIFQFSCRRAAFSLSSSLRHHLCGRDMVQPTDFNADEWKRILWYAFDLKRAVSDGSALNMLSNKHVTFLIMKQNGRNLLSSSLGCQLLGAKPTVYIHPDFEYHLHCIDCGRALSQLTDIMLVNGSNQMVLSELAEGSSVPVIGLNTTMFSMIGPMAFLMTLQERYGYLKRLKVAWVGPASPTCNTILSVYPLFGINVKICCICSHGTGLMSPIIMENALKACKEGSAELHQNSTPAEAIYRSHVVITSLHPEAQYQITIQMMEEAEFEWTFFHALPRSNKEVTDDVFKHKNNLTWPASTNYLYVAMALMVSALLDYTPVIPRPNFEGSP